MTGNASLSAPSWRIRVRDLTAALLNSFLPPVCANCGKVGALLCQDCIASLPRPREPLCLRCGRMVNQATAKCHSCRQNPFPLQQARAPLLFSGPVQEIIHKLKYNGQFALAEPLAQLMVESWPQWQASINLVLPIPLSAQRRKMRGYNQSESLARHICRVLDFATDPDALRRIRHTQPQVDLSAPDRRKNVAGAFWADRDKVVDQNVLLIDDVLTTGSTLSEGAKALLAAGAESVSGYCLARVS